MGPEKEKSERPKPHLITRGVIESSSLGIELVAAVRTRPQAGPDRRSHSDKGGSR